MAERIQNAIADFPYDREGITRSVSFMPSFYPGTAYVFLQLRFPESIAGDYETEYRPRRRAALEIACGAARNKFRHLTKVVGIAIDAPKGKPTNSEDFILMDGEWSDDQRKIYDELNKDLKFFETHELKTGRIHAKNFPDIGRKALSRPKVGRNAPCPCGSGRKFKRCHGR